MPHDSGSSIAFQDISLIFGRPEEKHMRGPVLFAVGLFAIGIGDAHATTLKDCSRLSMNKRISCLQENLILINKAHEETTLELRKKITELDRKVSALTADVEASGHKKAN